MTVELSIVIPSRNRPDCLVPLLDALTSQIGMRVDIEIVVCDEASMPGVAIQIATLPNRQAVAVLRHDVAKGPAAARNAGWQATAGAWIWFLDDDVLPDASAVAAALAATARAPDDVGIIEGPIRLAAAPARLLTDPLVRTLHPAGPNHRLTANIVYRRTALVAANGFDEAFPDAAGEDFDLAFRCEDAGWRHAYAEAMAVTHAVHGRFPLAAYLRHRSRQRGAVVRLYRRHPQRFGPDWIYRRFGALVHRRGSVVTTWTLFRFAVAENVTRLLAARRLWRHPGNAVKTVVVNLLDLAGALADYGLDRRGEFRVSGSTR